MDKKKLSQREKYHKVFAQIFQTIPDQEEIEKMSEFHKTDKNETDQQQMDQNVIYQKMIDQKMNVQNLIDQNVNDHKMYYVCITKAVLSSPFKPMTKLALLALMLLNDSLEFTVSINKLVDTLRVGRTTVIMMLRELKKWNLIVKQNRYGTTISLYKLLNRSECDRSKNERSKYDRSLEEEEEDIYKYNNPPLHQLIDQNVNDQNMIYPQLDALAILIMNANNIDLKKLDPETLNALSFLYQRDLQAFARTCYAARKSNINLGGFIRKTVREKKYDNLALEDIEKVSAIVEAAKRFMTALGKSVADWLQEVGNKQAIKDLSLLLGRPVIKNLLANEAERFVNKIKNAVEKYSSTDQD